jgi:hypothetical protein
VGGESKHKMGDKTILKQKKKNKLLEGRKEGRKKDSSLDGCMQEVEKC